MKWVFLALAVLTFACVARADPPKYATGYYSTNGAITMETITLAPSLTIMGGMVTVHPDGSIEYGKDYTPDAAAKAFWDAVGLERKSRR